MREEIRDIERLQHMLEDYRHPIIASNDRTIDRGTVIGNKL